MWLDRVSNTGYLAFESDALPTALRGLAKYTVLIPLNAPGVNLQRNQIYYFASFHSMGSLLKERICSSKSRPHFKGLP